MAMNSASLTSSLFSDLPQIGRVEYYPSIGSTNDRARELARQGTPEIALVVAVIVRNGRYQALEEFGTLFGLPRTVGTKLPAIDFVALAKGHGIDGCRVERPDALEGALRDALGSDKPILVEVVVD